MTDTATLTAAELEARLAELERRLGVDPAALVPPITIGELTNVPTPGSQLAAQWAQDVSSRVIQRFPNGTALTAWAAPVGAYAEQTDTAVLWRRTAAGWSQVTPWHATAIGIAAGASTGNSGQQVLATIGVPADPGNRTVYASCFVYLETGGSYRNWIELIIDSAQVAVAEYPVAGQNGSHNVHLSGNYNLPIGRAVNVVMRVSPEVGNVGSYNVRAGPQYSRLDCTVTPRGY
jgi:hypothetical protein